MIKVQLIKIIYNYNKSNFKLRPFIKEKWGNINFHKVTSNINYLIINHDPHYCILYYDV